MQEGACICWALVSDSDGCLGLRPGGWRRRGSAGGGEGRVGAEGAKGCSRKGGWRGKGGCMRTDFTAEGNLQILCVATLKG